MPRKISSGSDNLANVALAVLAVVVLAFAAYAIKAQGSSSAASSPVTTTAPSAAASPAAATTSLWFGDSIVEGCCRTSPTAPNMAMVASAALGWTDPDVHGFGGTGYLTSSTVNGVTRPPYTKSITPLLPETHYDVVVVAGGNNDVHPGLDLAAFRAAVRNTLGQVRAALPRAQMIVVGPYSPSGTGDDAVRAVEREEAARLKVPFIDQIAEGWFVGHPEFVGKDQFHPNDAGQAYLGRRLAADIRRALPSLAAPAATSPSGSGTPTP